MLMLGGQGGEVELTIMPHHYSKYSDCPKIVPSVQLGSTSTKYSNDPPVLCWKKEFKDFKGIIF